MQLFTEHCWQERCVKAAGLAGEGNPISPGLQLRAHRKQRQGGEKTGPKLAMTDALQLTQEIYLYRRQKEQRQKNKQTNKNFKLPFSSSTKFF